MMRWLVVSLGLLSGIAIAVAGILLRPTQLLQSSSVFDNSDAVRMEFAQSLQRGLGVSPMAAIGLGDGVGGGLGDAALAHVRFDLMVLDGGELGGQALAVKLTSLSRDNDLLGGRLSTQTAWNVVWPGQGSLFLVGEEDQWPLLADTIRRGFTGAGFSPEAREYAMNGEQPGSALQVVGASGRLDKVSGRSRVWQSLPGSGGALELQLKNP